MTDEELYETRKKFFQQGIEAGRMQMKKEVRKIISAALKNL